MSAKDEGRAPVEPGADVKGKPMSSEEVIELFPEDIFAVGDVLYVCDNPEDQKRKVAAQVVRDLAEDRGEVAPEEALSLSLMGKEMSPQLFEDMARHDGQKATMRGNVAHLHVLAEHILFRVWEPLASAGARSTAGTGEGDGVSMGADGSTMLEGVQRANVALALVSKPGVPPAPKDVYTAYEAFADWSQIEVLRQGTPEGHAALVQALTSTVTAMIVYSTLRQFGQRVKHTEKLWTVRYGGDQMTAKLRDLVSIVYFDVAAQYCLADDGREIDTYEMLMKVHQQNSARPALERKLVEVRNELDARLEALLDLKSAEKSEEECRAVRFAVHFIFDELCLGEGGAHAAADRAGQLFAQSGDAHIAPGPTAHQKVTAYLALLGKYDKILDVPPDNSTSLSHLVRLRFGLLNGGDGGIGGQGTRDQVTYSSSFCRTARSVSLRLLFPGWKKFHSVLLTIWVCPTTFWSVYIPTPLVFIVIDMVLRGYCNKHDKGTYTYAHLYGAGTPRRRLSEAESTRIRGKRSGFSRALRNVLSSQIQRLDLAREFVRGGLDFLYAQA